MFLAHSRNALGRDQDLVVHLQAVAELASRFAEKLQAGELGRWAGLWHDLGKFHPDFQAYLTGALPRGPDHKAAGALVALEAMEPLGLIVAGHHGGLPNMADLKSRLRDKALVAAAAEALESASQQGYAFRSTEALAAPGYVEFERDAEFFLRLLFSALVDADFLDTERHFSPEASGLRGPKADLKELWSRFEADQAAFRGRVGTVNEVRDEVYRACLRAAPGPPGVFRLAVPTGGGKTRSGMAFALCHALRHGLDRVIVAIPYTSIIEQTADVYRGILGSEAVLEHHSAVDDESELARLAAENWDAPVVVTTTVQLFESLFGNRPGACRKLHNIARSVLVLDEVQTLPTHLLEPILDGLRQLVTHYGVTVVLSTATQPALEDSPYLRGLPEVQDIIPEPLPLFQAMQRVHYEWAAGGRPVSWERMAAEMRSAVQALAVVNTKADALALLGALDDPEALHLSTLLCGAHRREVLAEVRRRLSAGQPCRLVSTQVVEAGVDLDFPFVLRAIGPLDSIIQAAGRCNREGKAVSGRVVLFDPEQGATPSGPYRTGTDIARSMMREGGLDLHDPALFQDYFRRLYQACPLDREGIQDLREGFNYEEVARRFRLIDEDSVPVVVPYRGRTGEDGTAQSLLGLLQAKADESPRWLLRRLQPYLVNVPRRQVSDLERRGLISPVIPGLYEWHGRYDPIRGLVAEDIGPEQLVI